ncbi:MAG TPA: SIS domain-containing protein [bacterium]|nr:SIS domain-containing protein [bacterium]
MKDNIIEEILKVLEKVDERECKSLFSYIRKAKRVFLAGAGRSGLIGRCFAMRLMHLGIEAHVAGETTCPSIKKGDLLVVISCSGGNKNLLEFARIARKVKAKVVSVTLEGTSLAAVSDYSVKIPLAKSVQFGNSLFEQAVFLFLETSVANYRENRKILLKDMASRHANLE